MQISILGPLEVRGEGGVPIEVAGARLRTLLARLSVDAPRPVSVGALIDAVWGDRPPAEASNALQTLVSRLRRALGDTGAIVQSGAGYQLAVEPVDAHRFETAAAAATSAAARDEHDAAITHADAALGLWRAPALVDLRDSGAALGANAVRLDDLRLAVIVARAQAQLATGAAVDLGELEALTLDHPLDERLAAVLIRALAAAGRNADALRGYERLRRDLADELGTDPAPEVQDVHLALLRGDIAPARPSAPRRTNLKAQLTTFVGRDEEVARIGKSLEQHRLVTLVGPGGAGKTRLATEAAGTVADEMPDGVWLVELAPVSSGADVAQAVLSSLGLRDINVFERRATISARDANTQLLEGLADRVLLIVLDNCEHLIDSCAALADSLLTRCPGLRVLATSREPLGILGEALLTVPPLGQPAPTASATEALDYPAVRLFADRAAAVNPQFTIDDSTVGAVVEVVGRLDGLPLAIELAAARLRTLPIDDIAARLSDRFRLLTGGSRTALPRHRTLRAVVEWSWGLLSDTERDLAEQLSVFPSGVTASSAAAISEVGADDLDVEDLLASLVDKSLLQPTADGRRMRMLETIREYGIERLAERGELAAVRARHAAHFAAVVAQAEPHLTRGDQLPWFALIDAEHDNMLAAMRYRADLGDVDSALDIGIVLACHAMMMGSNADIPAWMDDVLRVPGGDPGRRVIGEALRALNLVAGGPHQLTDDRDPPDLADLAARMDDVPPTRSPFVALLRPATAFFAENVEVTRRYIAETRAGDEPWGRAAALMLSAAMAENEGDVDGMRRDAEAALGEFRVLGERWGLASTLRTLGQIRTLDGDLDGAESVLLEAMQVTRELGSRDDEGFVLGRLADLSLRRGNLTAARRYAERTREHTETSGAPMEAIFSLAVRSAVEQAAGNRAEARALHQEAADRVAAMPVGHPAQGHIRAIVFAVSARIALDDGDLDAAREGGGAAYEAAVGTNDLPIIASVGVTLAAIVASDRPDEAAVVLGASARLRGADDATAVEIRDLTATLRVALGEQAFEARYAEGRSLDRDAALARLDPS